MISQFHTIVNPATSRVPTKVTVDEVKRRMDRGESLILLDNRDSKVWAASNVKLPGALHVSPDDVKTRLKDLPRNTSIITYCDGPDEVFSDRVAQELYGHGFGNIRVLYGGLDLWQRAGYGVEELELKKPQTARKQSKAAVNPDYVSERRGTAWISIALLKASCKCMSRIFSNMFNF
jgi:rhodanese-related sulfurtransferase